jgi:hypothetical protein
LSSGYAHQPDPNNQCYQNTNIQKIFKDNTLSQLDQELDMTLKEMSRKKPPVAPRKPYRDLDQSDSSSDQERPKASSIMAKVSKFEYYAKQQKCIGRSQFYTNNDNEISPKVFSSNSLTVNTPAKDVLGGKTMPNYIKVKENKVVPTENNLDPKNSSYTNVTVRNKNKIDDIVRNFDENTRNDYNKPLPKKINNDQVKTDNIYGKINVKQEIEKNKDHSKNNMDHSKNNTDPMKNNADPTKFNVEYSRMEVEQSRNDGYGRIVERNANVAKPLTLAPTFDKNLQYSPVYTNAHYDRSLDAEHMRKKVCSVIVFSIQLTI